MVDGYCTVHGRAKDRYPQDYSPGWYQCPCCKHYWHSSEDAHRSDVAWDMPPECGPCGGIEMERLPIPGSIHPQDAIQAGLALLTSNRKLDSLLSALEYTLATIGPGGTVATEDEAWVKVHGGRARSAHRQLTGQKRRMEELMAQAKGHEGLSRAESRETITGEPVKSGDDVLINHPLFGSLWLTDVTLHCNDARPDWLVGWAEDRSVPEGRSVMNFPVSCVRQVNR